MNRFGRTLLTGAGALCLTATLASNPSVRAATGSTAHTSVSHPSASHVKHSYASRHATNPGHFDTYTIEPADTLWGIARRTGLTVASLKRVNRLYSDTIYPGQHLKVPTTNASLRLHSVGRSLSFDHTAAGESNSSVVRRQAPQSQQTPSMPGVPSTLVPVYKAAGSTYGIPWTVLAAIHETETHFAVSNCGISSAGAIGPMQFLPATFHAYAVKASDHAGPADIQNVNDAIFTAAHMLQADGYSQSPANAIYHFNHSEEYVHHILTLAGVGNE